MKRNNFSLVCQKSYILIGEHREQTHTKKQTNVIISGSSKCPEIKWGTIGESTGGWGWKVAHCLSESMKMSPPRDHLSWGPNDTGLPQWLSGKEFTCSAGVAGDVGSIPGLGRFPWRRAWQPTLVFLPWESHRQRSLAGYGLWGRKESDTTEATSHTYTPNKTETGTQRSERRVLQTVRTAGAVVSRLRVVERPVRLEGKKQ